MKMPYCRATVAAMIVVAGIAFCLPAHASSFSVAGSYADCAAAGGYILVGADDSGDDDLFYLSEFRIYEGAVAVTEILPVSEATAYEAWAAANGVAGAWNATDASGIHNVFRYLFDVPTGPFTNPPILSISFDASGRPLILTPPLNPVATGFDLSILATDNLDGTGNATTYPLDASGETTINETGKTYRFFRLRAVAQ